MDNFEKTREMRLDVQESTVEHETHFVDIAGKSIELTEGGQGSPLLYLHSAGGETEWTSFHNLLAKNHRVYIPAHPGFSNSDGLDEIDDMDDLVWHYVDLLDELGLKSVPIVGYSLGGWLGTELAIRRPERVEKLILVNSAGLHIDGAPMAELFIDDIDKLRELLFFDPDSPVVEQAMPLNYEDSRIVLWLKAREATARVGWNPYLHNPKLLNNLRRVECPTRVIWADNDQLIPVPHGEAFAKGIRNAELHIVKEAGHMMPFEKPEEFTRLVLPFLNS